jgi:NADPH2:quinone reductase
MKAIRYEAYGGYEENRLVELPVPAPVDGEVLLKMRTVGINPLDNTFRSGKHPAANDSNLSRIGGQSGVGEVVETRTDAYRLGDRVIVAGGGFGRTVDGVWREFMAVSPAFLSAVPPGVDDDTAAAFVAGAGYLTGYLALTALAAFGPGQIVLAPGIGGAVGMETVQVARHLGAAMAISTASTTKKADQARAAGYDEVIDLSVEPLRDGVMRLTKGKGVDVIVDGVGGAFAGEALGTLAFGGMWISVGYAGGRTTTVDVTDLIWRGATVRGFIFRPEIFSAETIASAQNACRALLMQGALTPTIGRIFPLAEAAEAVRFLIEDRPFGRVLLKVAD